MTIEKAHLDIYMKFVCAVNKKYDRDGVRKTLAKLVLEGRMNSDLVREAQEILAAPQDVV